LIGKTRIHLLFIGVKGIPSIPPFSSASGINEL
jgi:hypothetical protein